MTLPRSDQSTISWISTIEALLESPMPKPTTADPAPATKGEVAGLSKTKTSAPSGISAAPTTQDRAKAEPRHQSRVESVAPIGQPSTMAESAKPATSGDLPHDALHVDRQEGREPDHRHAGEQRRGVDRGDRPPAPELERDHRLGRAALLDDESATTAATAIAVRTAISRPARRRQRGQPGHHRGDREGEHAGARDDRSARAASSTIFSCR